MALSYKVPSLRSQNSVSQIGAGQKLVSRTGLKTAISRNQKRQLGNGLYDVVECWTLKQRINGKMVIVEIQRGREEAEAWVLSE